MSQSITRPSRRPVASRGASLARREGLVMLMLRMGDLRSWQLLTTQPSSTSKKTMLLPLPPTTPQLRMRSSSWPNVRIWMGQCLSVRHSALTQALYPVSTCRTALA